MRGRGFSFLRCDILGTSGASVSATRATHARSKCGVQILSVMRILGAMQILGAMTPRQLYLNKMKPPGLMSRRLVAKLLAQSCWFNLAR
jgi:hypothetical protein